MDLYYTNLAQHLNTTGYDLDELDRDLSDISDVIYLIYLICAIMIYLIGPKSEGLGGSRCFCVFSWSEELLECNSSPGDGATRLVCQLAKYRVCSELVHRLFRTLVLPHPNCAAPQLRRIPTALHPRFTPHPNCAAALVFRSPKSERGERTSRASISQRPNDAASHLRRFPIAPHPDLASAPTAPLTHSNCASLL